MENDIANKIDKVDIKGYRSGIAMIISPELSLSDLEPVLAKRLEKIGRFLAGTSVIVDLGDRNVTDDDLRNLQKLLRRKFDLDIGGLRTSSSKTRGAAEVLRLEVEEPPAAVEELDLPAVQLDRVDTMMIKSTLRSGQQRRFLEGNILVLGDVNPGAELIAAGDIVVMGALRGVAHAGFLGDESAAIIALSLEPTQLRIANFIAQPPSGRKSNHVPEIARIEGGNIVVHDYKGF